MLNVLMSLKSDTRKKKGEKGEKGKRPISNETKEKGDKEKGDKEKEAGQEDPAKDPVKEADLLLMQRQVSRGQPKFGLQF